MQILFLYLETPILMASHGGIDSPVYIQDQNTEKVEFVRNIEKLNLFMIGITIYCS